MQPSFSERHGEWRTLGDLPANVIISIFIFLGIENWPLLTSLNRKLRHLALNDRRFINHRAIFIYSHRLPLFFELRGRSKQVQQTHLEDLLTGGHIGSLNLNLDVVPSLPSVFTNITPNSINFNDINQYLLDLKAHTCASLVKLSRLTSTPESTVDLCYGPWNKTLSRICASHAAVEVLDMTRNLNELCLTDFSKPSDLRKLISLQIPSGTRDLLSTFPSTVECFRDLLSPTLGGERNELRCLTSDSSNSTSHAANAVDASSSPDLMTEIRQYPFHRGNNYAHPKPPTTKEKTAFVLVSYLLQQKIFALGVSVGTALQKSALYITNLRLSGVLYRTKPFLDGIGYSRTLLETSHSLEFFDSYKPSRPTARAYDDSALPGALLRSESDISRRAKKQQGLFCVPEKEKYRQILCPRLKGYDGPPVLFDLLAAPNVISLKLTQIVEFSELWSCIEPLQSTLRSLRAITSTEADGQRKEQWDHPPLMMSSLANFSLRIQDRDFSPHLLAIFFGAVCAPRLRCYCVMYSPLAIMLSSRTSWTLPLPLCAHKVVHLELPDTRLIMTNPNLLEKVETIRGSAQTLFSLPSLPNLQTVICTSLRSTRMVQFAKWLNLMPQCSALSLPYDTPYSQATFEHLRTTSFIGQILSHFPCAQKHIGRRPVSVIHVLSAAILYKHFPCIEELWLDGDLITEEVFRLKELLSLRPQIRTLALCSLPPQALDVLRELGFSHSHRRTGYRAILETPETSWKRGCALYTDCGVMLPQFECSCPLCGDLDENLDLPDLPLFFQR